MTDEEFEPPTDEEGQRLWRRAAACRNDSEHRSLLDSLDTGFRFPEQYQVAVRTLIEQLDTFDAPE